MTSQHERAGSLSTEAIERFHEEGYLGPFTVRSREEMEAIRRRVDDTVLPTDGPQGNPLHDRHRDNRFLYDLFTDPAIVERMASIYGPDLLLWASHFWDKPPGGKATAWHQDGNHWPLEPKLTISAWIAFTEATEENSCIQIVPRSHGAILPEVEAPNSVIPVKTDPEYVDTDDAVSMVVEPGQFFLFNERTVHHASKNDSDRRRLGASMRVTAPFVQIDHESPALYPEHDALLLRGEDWQGINEIGSPPEA